MTTPTTAELLKYADLQMAAEAFLTNPNGTIRTDLKAVLIDAQCPPAAGSKLIQLKSSWRDHYAL